jgi:hypothetical protein
MGAYGTDEGTAAFTHCLTQCAYDITHDQSVWRAFNGYDYFCVRYQDAYSSNLNGIKIAANVADAAGELSAEIPGVGEYLEAGGLIVDGLLELTADILLWANPVHCYYIRSGTGPNNRNEYTVKSDWSWRTSRSCRQPSDCYG